MHHLWIRQSVLNADNVIVIAALLYNNLAMTSPYWCPPSRLCLCLLCPVMYYVSNVSSMEASQLPSKKYEIMGKLGAEMALSLPPWLPKYDVKWLNMNCTCTKVKLECKSQSFQICQVKAMFLFPVEMRMWEETAKEAGDVCGQF